MPQVQLEASPVFSTPELLENILKYIGLQGSVEIQPGIWKAADLNSPGFYDLWIIGRTVNHTWKGLIETSPILKRLTYRSTLQDRILHNAQDAYVLAEMEPQMCYPLCNYIARSLSKVGFRSIAEINQTAWDDWLKRCEEHLPKGLMFSQPPVSSSMFRIAHHPGIYMNLYFYGEDDSDEDKDKEVISFYRVSGANYSIRRVEDYNHDTPPILRYSSFVLENPSTGISAANIIDVIARSILQVARAQKSYHNEIIELGFVEQVQIEREVYLCDPYASYFSMPTTGNGETETRLRYVRDL